MPGVRLFLGAKRLDLEGQFGTFKGDRTVQCSVKLGFEQLVVIREQVESRNTVLMKICLSATAN